MRRCWGITRKGGFCKRHGNWWIFCPGHKWKVVATVSLVFLPVIHFSGSIASIYSLLPNQHVAKLSKDMEDLKINFKIVTDQNEQTKQILLIATEQHQKAEKAHAEAEKARTKVAEHSTSSLSSLSQGMGVLPGLGSLPPTSPLLSSIGYGASGSAQVSKTTVTGLPIAPVTLESLTKPSGASAYSPVLATDWLTKAPLSGLSTGGTDSFKTLSSAPLSGVPITPVTLESLTRSSLTGAYIPGLPADTLTNTLGASTFHPMLATDTLTKTTVTGVPITPVTTDWLKQK